MSQEADPRLAWAQSFGSDPERYDRARPRYPDALVERIVAASPGPDVLDVGCGTGILAHQLEAAGCKVLGVEPDERMADAARRGGLDVEVSKFEDWDRARRTFDSVTAGQSWHWVDPVAGAAKAAEALRPRGLLTAFWNVGQPSPEAAEAFTAVYRRVMPESLANIWARPVLDGYARVFAKVADGIREAGGFGAPDEWRREWDWSYERDDWLDQVPTHGGHSDLPPARLAELVAGVGAALDGLGGSFTMRYTTVAITAARQPAGPRGATASASGGSTA
jgi:SAM-dependent methyltransferase